MFIATATLAGGCLNLNFEAQSFVSKERVLAITVDHPEGPLVLEGGLLPRVGEDFVFEALVVAGDGSPLDPSRADVRYEWSVCASAAQLIAAVGLPRPDSDPEECAPGGPARIELEQGGDLPPFAARLRREQLDAAFERLLATLAGGGAGGGGGDPIDPEQAQTLLTVLANVGLPLSVDLRVLAGPQEEVELLAFKRFAIAMRPDLTTNPPPPRFAFEQSWMSALQGTDPHRCSPENGERPIVPAGAVATLTPEGNEATWIESYPVYDFGGQVQLNYESAYYSWYSTGGSFESPTTGVGEREVDWTAPVVPGVYPIWLVVRDGHLGASFCRAEIEVRPSL